MPSSLSSDRWHIHPPVLFTGETCHTITFACKGLRPSKNREGLPAVYMGIILAADIAGVRHGSCSYQHPQDTQAAWQRSSPQQGRASTFHLGIVTLMSEAIIIILRTLGAERLPGPQQGASYQQLHIGQCYAYQQQPGAGSLARPERISCLCQVPAVPARIIQIHMGRRAVLPIMQGIMPVPSMCCRALMACRCRMG